MDSLSDAPVPVIYDHPTQLGKTTYFDSAKQLGQIQASDRLDGGVASSPYTLSAERALKYRDQMSVLYKKHEADDIRGGATPPDAELYKADFGNDFSGLKQDFERAGMQIPETDEELVASALVKLQQTREQAEVLRPEVESYMQEFREIALDAVKNRSLPLTIEQVNQRLSDINKKSFDKMHSSLTSADFWRQGRTLRVNVDSFKGEYQKKLRKSIFHEMWHALAGVRVADMDYHTNRMAFRRAGFEHRNNGYVRGSSLDEGFVDLLAVAWADGIKVDFAATGFRSRRQWGKLAHRFSSSKYSSYNHEGEFITGVFADIDFATVAKAYLKSDFDVYEEDKLAGTHAARDMQHEIKIKGGLKRPAVIRALDRDLQEGSVKEVKKAAKRAQRIGLRSEFTPLPVRRIKRRLNSRRLQDIQERRSAGIEAAKRQSILGQRVVQGS